MKYLPGLLILLFLVTCSQKKIDSAETKSSSSDFVCKLTTAELQERKTNVLAMLRTLVLEKKELDNGYAFKFRGGDAMIDSLTAFAKSERQCCGFFTFEIRMNGDTSFVWLNITGPQGVKDVIHDELEL